MYWGVFTVIIVSPWHLKVLTNMHKFLISFCAILLIKTCCPLFRSNWFFNIKKHCSLNYETSGIRSTLRFGPRWTDVPRTSSAPTNYVVRSSIHNISIEKENHHSYEWWFSFSNETSGIRTPDNLIKSQVLYHLS